MLVHAAGDARAALAAGPRLDREATERFARALFPDEKLTPLSDGDLSDTNPQDGELFVGSFAGASIVAAREFGHDRPSQLPARFLGADRRGTVLLHAMHSVVDWFAFAKWIDGRLVRALSLAPDSGILEDVGARLPFEQPYWSGQHPAVDPEEEPAEYPFPFHPLELGEAALAELFGYHLEGPNDPSLLDPFSVPLMRFRRSNGRKPWWRFW